MSPATLMHHHRIIRAALNQAKKWKYIPVNPAEDVDLTPGQRPEMHVPTLDQARALVLRAAKTSSPDLGPILLFDMLTGMRRGELCGVQWSDINWDTSRVTVRRSVWQVRSSWGLKDPKTHQVRTIALDPVGVSVLTARKARADSDGGPGRRAALGGRLRMVRIPRRALAPNTEQPHQSVSPTLQDDGRRSARR